MSIPVDTLLGFPSVPADPQRVDYKHQAAEVAEKVQWVDEDMQ